MTTSAPVLVSWVAVNNDPYERKFRTGEFALVNGQRIPGPTLTLLLDNDSPYSGKIRNVVLLHRKGDGKDDEKERLAISETIDALKEIDAGIHVHLEPWRGSDPTDHREIFQFMREALPRIRRRFAKNELVLHISPGTASMHTIWVLMAETGFVDPPFQMVQSLRKKDRNGRPPVVPVEVGIDTFYKAYRASRPSQISSEEQAVEWDRKRFRTDRLKDLYDEARRFAQVKVPVLILGERGTGKSTLAGWIRSHSPYRKEKLDSHWPAVACGQYTPELIRGELFGWKKGSHSKADQDKTGLLADAHKETLFLDEIGDLDVDNQRLLIKAIEEKKFFPIGGGAEDVQQSDFRLICATNLDDDEFRKRVTPDFRDRIDNLVLRFPPLRDIRDELEWIWDSVFYTAAARAGVRRRTMEFASSHHQRVVSHLRTHPLPGNMRDLYRVAYRIVAARADAHKQLSPADAAEYGLAALSETAAPPSGTASQAVARAFADSSPLDGVVQSAGIISTKNLNLEIQTFIATEIRRISKTSGRPVEDLCDVSDRSLRTWTRNEVGGTELPPCGSSVPKTAKRPRRKKS